MDLEKLRKELHDTYMNTYAAGFKANDMSLINKAVKYPIAHIKNGVVTLCDEYPVDPGKLKEEIQWDHSTDWKFDILAVSEQSAHAVASAIRCRRDGSPIENVHGFYAFTMTDEGWKMYAVADTTF